MNFPAGMEPLTISQAMRCAPLVWERIDPKP
jgi:hypothetical protein